MKAVFKYPLESGFKGQVIYVPACATFRHFADQDGVLTVWLEVDTENDKVKRSYQIFGTGWEIPTGARWLATCQQGVYVWHLYQLD